MDRTSLVRFIPQAQLKHERKERETWNKTFACSRTVARSSNIVVVKQQRKKWNQLQTQDDNNEKPKLYLC